MLIKEIMTTDVQVIDPTEPVSAVAKIMLMHDCGCVLVAQDDRLVGMVTDRDIALRCVAGGHSPVDTTAEKVMTPQILYCRETDDADDVAANMAVNKVRRLPVINTEKRLVGIISLGDIASHSNHELCGETLGDICRAA